MINLCKYKTFLIIIPGILLGTQFLFSQEKWEAPLDKSQKVSPFLFDDESRNAGQVIFQNNCTKCHGSIGKNNPASQNPSPGDPAGEKFQKETDGALFYKITTGNGMMPDFKDALSEKERWQVISYFRSFHKNYIQPEPVSAPAGAYAGMTVDFEIVQLDSAKVIKVVAKGKKNNENTNLAGIELGLFAKSYFGYLPVDEPKQTNAKGEAYFAYSKKLKGDTLGNIKFLIKINTEGLDGVRKEKTLRAGVPVFPKSLTDTKAMWAVRSKAPIWLILAYCLGVIGVWGVIIKIIRSIMKIREIGKS